jgi:Leucine-rich repeat (LRR) protein
MSSCQTYRVSFNEMSVYTPPNTLEQIPVSDDQLKACIQQHLVDKAITSRDQLTKLVCTSAGITSTNGLSYFYGLEQLNLAENNVTDLDGLAGLSNLVELSLKNNEISSIQALLELPNLEYLVLTGNSAISCRDLDQLETASTTQIERPVSCQGN